MMGTVRSHRNLSVGSLKAQLLEICSRAIHAAVSAAITGLEVFKRIRAAGPFFFGQVKLQHREGARLKFYLAQNRT